MIFFMMIIWLNKHMYDVMIILIMSFLWIKLNVNLSKFLTKAQVKRPGPVPLCQGGAGVRGFLSLCEVFSITIMPMGGLTMYDPFASTSVL
jgi:hypothetical protein